MYRQAPAQYASPKHHRCVWWPLDRIVWGDGCYRADILFYSHPPCDPIVTEHTRRVIARPGNQQTPRKLFCFPPRIPSNRLHSHSGYAWMPIPRPLCFCLLVTVTGDPMFVHSSPLPIGSTPLTIQLSFIRCGRWSNVHTVGDRVALAGDGIQRVYLGIDCNSRSDVVSRMASDWGSAY